MQIIKELKNIGYDVWVKNEKVYYEKKINLKPSGNDVNVATDAKIDDLLYQLKQQKQDVIKYLSKEERYSIPTRLLDIDGNVVMKDKDGNIKECILFDRSKEAL